MYIKQLTAIERRQARIRRIQGRMKPAEAPLQPGDTGAVLECAKSSQAQYHVGKSQNEPEALSAFLIKNGGDPAIKVGGIYGQHWL